MDGYEATRQIRARQGASDHIPIIAMTAGAMTGDAARCLAAGMDDYLSKPVSLQELETTLRRWVPSGRADVSRPEDAPPAVDAAQLAQLRELYGADGSDELSVLLQTFLDSAPAAIGSVKSAVHQGNPRATASAAHALRGSAANMGATALAGACAEIERLAKGGTIASSQLVAQLTVDLDRFRQAVQHELHGSASAVDR